MVLRVQCLNAPSAAAHNTTPPINPAPTVLTADSKTILRTAARLDPTAIRIPNSRSRCTAANDITL
jgi:hypothetical protein